MRKSLLKCDTVSIHLRQRADMQESSREFVIPNTLITLSKISLLIFNFLITEGEWHTGWKSFPLLCICALTPYLIVVHFEDLQPNWDWSGFILIPHCTFSKYAVKFLDFIPLFMQIVPGLWLSLALKACFLPQPHDPSQSKQSWWHSFKSRSQFPRIEQMNETLSI